MEILNRLFGQSPRVRSDVMEGQLIDVGARVHAVKCLERFCDRRVQRPGAREAQLRVERLLQERMCKVVHDLATLGVFVDDASAPKLVEGAEERLLGELADERQRVVRRARADRRREIGQPSRVRRKLPEPGNDDVTNRLRQLELEQIPRRWLVRVTTDGFRERLDGLLDE